MKILFVDDDPLFLAVAESVVASIGGHDTTCIEGGALGLATMSADPGSFDVLVVDLNMPGLDGFGFLRQASELGFGGNVIVSSGESPAILQSALKMGELLHLNVVGTMRKPLTPSKLLPLLEACRAPRRKAIQGNRFSPPDRLEDLELVPFYQAQHDVSRRSITGVEALIRARSPDGRIHGPAKLFGMIHNHVELSALSMTIAGKVLDDVRIWQGAGIYCRTSINFDALVIEDPAIGKELMRMVAARQLEPKWICIELTEVSLPQDLSGLVAALARLRMAGFSVSLDDYGTGSSNFDLLRLCPFSELKIDGTIMRAAPDDPISRRFLNSSLSLASELSLDVVAEGIETEPQLKTALSCGVKIVQGFLFSKPVPADDMQSLLFAENTRRFA